MKKFLGGLAAAVTALTLAAFAYDEPNEPPLNETTSTIEVYAYLAENGVIIRGQDADKYLENVCIMVAEQGGLDTAADLVDIHDGSVTVDQVQKVVGAAVMTTCPEREHKLEDDGDWW